MTRRHVLKLAAGVAIVSAAGAWGLTGPAVAQRKRGPALAEVPVDELMKPGPLPELTLGKADAPITVVEYASMTCGHCASFHNNVFPKLKEKYIDTGKVRFILREFPLDDKATGAAMLARCTGEGKTLPFASALFAKQDEWAFVGEKNFIPELLKFARQAGFTEESFFQCLRNQELMDNVLSVRKRAVETFGVSSTPTFFVNGKRLAGVALEDFEKAFEPILKS